MRRAGTDFLSAPSAMFMLTDQLTSPQFVADNVSVDDNNCNMCVMDNALTFNVAGNNDFNVEYRCMFLSQDYDDAETLSTQKDNDTKWKQLKTQASDHQSEISVVEEKITAFKATNQAALKKLLANEKVQQAIVTNAQKKYTGKQVSAAQAKLTKLADLGAQLSKLESQLTSLKQVHKEVKTQISNNPASGKEASGDDSSNMTLEELNANIEPLSFFFNKTLAEHVPAGSYSNPGSQVIVDATDDSPAAVNCSCVLEAETTDNFGNLLVEGHYYIPVVLTVSSDEELNPEQFNNSLSDFDSTPMFKYSPKG